MTRLPTPRLFPFALAAVAGCGDGSGPGQTVLDCEEVAPTSLGAGQVQQTDASEVACLRLAEVGTEGAEYLYVAYSAAGEETSGGTSAEYELTGAAGAPPPATATRGRPPGTAVGADPGDAFHRRLRRLERELARDRRAARSGPHPSLRAAAGPPAPGETRTFNVLRSASVTGEEPADYVQVDGTARYVGSRVAIFLDDAVPTQGGYTQEDLDAVGALFDDHLHTIAVNAFGAETDVNGDGMVLVLLTDRVTRLAGCGQGQFVAGLFFAVDLFENLAGSNNAEIFYGLTPDASCGVDRTRALQVLPGVFVHEFQHMINYGRKVIEGGGDAEATWLNEGLSGFAEELGARLVPAERCPASDCLTQFQRENLVNAYNYLLQEDSAYLVGPSDPPIGLTQYGSAWLFVRWLADHFADDPILGTDLTRALVTSGEAGAENVASATGESFARLVGEWQLANYLEGRSDLAALTEGTRFRYTSWDLVDIFGSFHAQSPAGFPRPYPIEPDLAGGEAYAASGTLRAGSGRHVLVRHAGAGAGFDLRLTAPGGETPLPAEVAPHTIVLRLR
ncbi:MAG TPA: hypothetical protein VHG35_16290 [Gemmatimonadales bacterium]|nr:hypothetical protein [Gemmatimonadales bacterium]